MPDAESEEEEDGETDAEEEEEPPATPARTWPWQRKPPGGGPKGSLAALHINICFL